MQKLNKTLSIYTSPEKRHYFSHIHMAYSRSIPKNQWNFSWPPYLNVYPFFYHWISTFLFFFPALLSSLHLWPNIHTLLIYNICQTSTEIWVPWAQGFLWFVHCCTLCSEQNLVLNRSWTVTCWMNEWIGTKNG